MILHRVLNQTLTMPFSLHQFALGIFRTASICALTFAGVAGLAIDIATGSIINNITLQLGQSGGYSELYNAEAGGNGNGPTRLIRASQTGDAVQVGLEGNRLSGQYDTVSKILTITGTIPDSFAHNSLTLDNGKMVDGNSLVITGGKLIIDGTFGGGYLDYRLNLVNQSTGQIETTTGSFYFANNQDGDASTGPVLPGTDGWDGATIGFAEWGNNWTYAYAGVDWSFLYTVLGKNGPDGLDYYNAFNDRLGIRVAGSGLALLAPVPEPIALTVWGSLAFFGFFVRSRSKTR